METSTVSREELELLSDLDWFDVMCEVLTVKNHSTTRQLIDLIGQENETIKRESRGSKFLKPFDKRFNHAAINPDLSEGENDLPIEYFSVTGPEFKIKFEDLINRFPTYTTQRNTYDGGTQIFFYPIPERYEFSALEFWTSKEPEEIKDIYKLEFNSITFKFGEKRVLCRDGYSMGK